MNKKTLNRFTSHAAPPKKTKVTGLGSILYTELTKLNKKELTKQIELYNVWVSFFLSNILDEGSNDDAITEWYRECTRLHGHDGIGMVELDNYIREHLTTGTGLIILPYPKKLYENFFRLIKYQIKEVPTEYIDEYNSELLSFYGTIKDCYLSGCAPMGDGSVRKLSTSILHNYKQLVLILQTKMIPTPSSATITNEETCHSVASDEEIIIEERSEQQSTISVRASTPPDGRCTGGVDNPGTGINHKSLMSKYRAEIQAFYPPNQPPPGSVVSLVDLEVYYYKLNIDWDVQEHTKYKELISTSQYDAAWQLVNNTITNHIVSVLPSAPMNMGGQEVTAVNKLIDIIQKSPLIATPMTSLQTIVSSLMGLETQLTTLVTTSSQGRAAQGIDNVCRPVIAPVAQVPARHEARAGSSNDRPPVVPESFFD